MTNSNSSDRASLVDSVAQQTDPHRSDSGNNSTITVLLIDDNYSVRHSADVHLREAGYRVVTAEDGFEALSKAVEHQPDIIFASVMMPRLDGYQTCALLKNNAEFRTTPIVMVSSRDGRFDSERACLVGSDAHFTKPFSGSSLIDMVKALTRSAL